MELYWYHYYIKKYNNFTLCDECVCVRAHARVCMYHTSMCACVPYWIFVYLLDASYGKLSHSDSALSSPWLEAEEGHNCWLGGTITALVFTYIPRHEWMLHNNSILIARVALLEALTGTQGHRYCQAMFTWLPKWKIPRSTGQDFQSITTVFVYSVLVTNSLKGLLWV